MPTKVDSNLRAGDTTNNVATAFDFCAWGALQKADYANGRRMLLGYNQKCGQLTNLKLRTGDDTQTTVINTSYDYYTGGGGSGGNNGRIRYITDHLDGNYSVDVGAAQSSNEEMLKRYLTIIFALFLWLGFGVAISAGTIEPFTPQSETEKRININTALAEELMQLPGIGPGYAARIIAHRQKHDSFKRPQRHRHRSRLQREAVLRFRLWCRSSG